MKKNIILVTGGAGFIGSSLIKYFVSKNYNYKIISLDNYSTGSVKNHVKNKNVRYIKGQNKDINKLLKNLKKKIKIIFHFGEFSRIFQSFKNYKKCFEYNILHSSKVIEFAKDNNIKIVYLCEDKSHRALGKKRENLFVCGEINELINVSDVIIDFSNAKASLNLLKIVSNSKKKPAIVSGTTGFSSLQEKKFIALTKGIRILRSFNMSLGVNLLM